MVTVPASQSASSLLFETSSISRFSTNCSSLDALLTPPVSTLVHSDDTISASSSSRGLALGCTLEIIGPPGIGKTRTCLAMILAARFDAIEQEENCEVLVIDTEGSLTPQLIHETAIDYARHNARDPSSARLVCEGVHCKRIYEVSLLVAFFYSLSTWLAERPQVKLIVIDTLSSHLRPTSIDMSTRSMILSLIKSTITHVTSLQSVSFVVTTQMSIKMFDANGASSGFTQSAEALLVPQLGESWIGGRCWRIVLYYDYDGGRLAHLLDAHTPSQATKAAFIMDALGPCDLEFS